MLLGKKYMMIVHLLTISKLCSLMMLIDITSTSCSSFSLSTFSPSSVCGIGLRFELLGKSNKWQRSSKQMIIQLKTKRRLGRQIWPFRKWSTTKHRASIRDLNRFAAAEGRVAFKQANRLETIILKWKHQGRTRSYPLMSSKELFCNQEARAAATINLTLLNNLSQ